MTKAKKDKTDTSLEKREAQLPEGVEHIWEGKQFAPAADIYESGGNVMVVADMPGVGPGDVDITLEKKVLTIRGKVPDWTPPEGHRLAYAEYEVGNFVRNFVVSDEIDHENIQAQARDGVVTVTLPRKQPTRKRIEVKAD